MRNFRSWAAAALLLAPLAAQADPPAKPPSVERVLSDRIEARYRGRLGELEGGLLTCDGANSVLRDLRADDAKEIGKLTARIAELEALIAPRDPNGPGPGQ